MLATSRDGAQIYFEVTGSAETALVFVHGWCGNARWWDATRDALASTYQIVTLDLAGHGRSSAPRMPGSAEAYGADILAVVRSITATRVVLVGHSMSGAYVLAAAPEVERLAAIILVDTLKNLEMLPPREQTEPMLARYHTHFADMVANTLPKFLYVPETPQPVIDRLAGEFLARPGDVAAALLEPLYSYDIRAAAKRVRVPVRGIGSNVQPDGTAANRAYLTDYAYRALAGCGHYPMLEVPEAFDAALATELASLLA